MIPNTQSISIGSTSRLLRTHSQDGAVLVFFVGVLGILLLVIALAIDIGHLYRGRIVLQNAVDAAALSGMSYSIRQGRFGIDAETRASFGDWNDGTERNEKISQLLSLKTNQLIHSVMGRNGLPHHAGSAFEIHTTSTYSGVDPSAVVDITASYRVEASRRLDFFLIDLIPGFGGVDSQVLTARAQTQRKVANIVVLLDVSDSMNCPATGSCACMHDVTNPTPCARPSKMDHLIDALKVFMSKFDPATDRLYLVPFNIRSKVFRLSDYIRTFGGLPALDRLTEAQIDAILAQLRAQFSPVGSTNYCDAIMRSLTALNEDGVWGSEDLQFILFSDGAPTAGRFLLANPKAALPNWDQGSGPYDYVSYTVDWRKPQRPGEVFFGPSPLVQTDLLGLAMDSPEPPEDGSGRSDQGGRSDAAVAACSSFNPQSALRPVESEAQAANVASSVFSPCVNDLSARLPFGGQIYGQDYSNAGRGFSRWQEQYYNCAIMLSDLIRENRATFNVIAVGEPAGFDPANPDPYQDVRDVARVHHIFNARLAADSLRALSLRPNDPFPEFDFQGYVPYSNIPDSENAGSYLYAPDSSELQRLFEQIGNEILIRLIE